MLFSKIRCRLRYNSRTIKPLAAIIQFTAFNPYPTQLWDPIVGEDQSFQMSPVAPETAPRVSWPGSCHHEVGTEVSGLGDAEKCLPSIDFRAKTSCW